MMAIVCCGLSWIQKLLGSFKEQDTVEPPHFENYREHPFIYDIDYFRNAITFNRTECWKKDFPTLLPRQMAKAGLYLLSTDPQDPKNHVVSCRVCRIKLADWVSTDCPFMEHLRWSPTCPYALDVLRFCQVPLLEQYGEDVVDDGVIETWV